jgi:predicted RNA-binding protein with PUA-like domain
LKTVADKGADMALWLFKEEPDHYSFADLVREGSTLWDGVRNPLALKHLRQVRRGDRVLMYHSGKQKAIVAQLRIIGDPVQDPSSDNPRHVAVEVQPESALRKPVSLKTIKADPVLAGWDLVRLARLSVMPVTPQQWRRVEALSAD